MSLTPRQREALAVLKRHGGNAALAAEELGITVRNVHALTERARRADPAIEAAMEAAKTGLIPGAVWIKTGKDADGVSRSVYLRPPVDGGQDFLGEIRDAIADACSNAATSLPRRFTAESGNLLILDPADVHIGKLSVATETGCEYNSAVAEHRLIEGARLLMERGQREGITRVLLIIGNDISHIDTPRSATTSGTFQDADASIFSIYRAAQGAYIRIVRMALEMGLHIDVMFNPSNHDWVLGFTIAQAVGLVFKDHPNVGVSEYNLSERHRKYYRFERNLIGTSHGDGAKEAQLGDIMRVEARSHISECWHLYFYLHHYHHRMKKTLGVRAMDREKDHIGMEVIRSGAGAQEGDGCLIQYVRSASAPDGWHHRNGFLNRQAVEAFIHHPFDGRITSLTEWF